MHIMPLFTNFVEERFSEIRAKLEPVASCLWRKGLEPASALKREEGGGQNMPLYMTQVGYTSEAWAALTRNPEDRSEAFGSLAETLGGRLVSFYNSFGEYDVVVIYEAPDESTAAAIVLAAVSPGHLSGVKTTVLLSAEEGLEAMRKAGEATYRAPGQQQF
jgi:uncharacterized protein with GYD domain